MMRQIESGRFKPGDVLPSDQNLAEMFAVSRTVVREALARLKYEGVIESKRGSGPVVIGTSPERGFTMNLDGISQNELLEFMEFRMTLDGEAATMAALRHSEAQLEELREQLEGIRLAVENKESGNEPDFLFHQTVATAAQNQYLGDFMRFLSAKIWIGVHRARFMSNQRQELAEAVYQEHNAIFLAIEKRDPHEARAMAHRHILNSTRRQGLRPDESFLPKWRRYVY
jgi:DNA-binding FadR family transcriptional regulator